MKRLCFLCICVLASGLSTFAHDGEHPHAQPSGETVVAKGVVYHDQNGNQQRDDGEPGLAKIGVSNGEAIVETDADGRYEIEIDAEDGAVFVIKPRGWALPRNDVNLPQFFYLHKPQGSPDSRFPGVAPTGPLPDTIDFPLTPADEPLQFKAILFGDPQPRNQREVDYITHDVIEQIIAEQAHDASFGVTLGDIAFDNLDTFDSLNRAIALIGIPWYNVIGNHDLNYEAQNDAQSDETFERVYGPSYYSFNHGLVHFLVLDDVVWHGATEEEKGYYNGGLGERQMAFIKNDLARIPEDQLVVLFMHIPLVKVEDRQELYRLIEKRPATFSVAAHEHHQQHHLIGKEDGWRGPEPHHHLVNVTVSGSWWGGIPDGEGIPHTMMADGGPNGYTIVTFTDDKYDIAFRAARRPASYQMSLYLPEEITIPSEQPTRLIVNVFNGSEKSEVEYRIGDEGPFTAMERKTRTAPFYEDIWNYEKKLAEKFIDENDDFRPPWRMLPGPKQTPHIWEAELSEDLAEGTHRVEVHTIDQFGKSHTASRILRVKRNDVVASTAAN